MRAIRSGPSRGRSPPVSIIDTAVPYGDGELEKEPWPRLQKLEAGQRSGRHQGSLPPDEIGRIADTVRTSSRAVGAATSWTGPRHPSLQIPDYGKPADRRSAFGKCSTTRARVRAPVFKGSRFRSGDGTVGRYGGVIR